MSIRFVELTKTRRDGVVEELTFDPNVTAIVGPRNTSKTTILRMIDFCLGDADSAPEALGPAVAEAYAALELTIEVNGTRHEVSRALVPSVGHLTKVQVNEEELATREFQLWLMNELGWPELQIPKGRYYRSASDVVPLTFRTLFRHLYRKETSWFEFAAREEEFLRRAVIAFFLGVANARYSASLLEFQLGETERELASLEARRREVAEQGDALVRRLGEAMGLESLSLDRLDSLHAAAMERRLALDGNRQEILQTMRSGSDFVVEPGERYQALEAQIEAISSRLSELRRTSAGYEEAIAELRAQMARLERADAAVEAFAEVPVRSCPACGQDISPSSPLSECYVCHQELGPDVRSRRIQLELAALTRESQELEEVWAETKSGIGELSLRLEAMTAERESLRERLDRERADLIAPYLTQLEELSSRLGALDQQLATLDALRSLTARVETIDAQIRATATRLDQQSNEVNLLQSQRAIEEERTSSFAERMTDYLMNVQLEPWRFGTVTVASSDFSFYVGSRPWDAALGAESRVLFFLAYTEALFRLSEISSETHQAGFAILDNPLQQGVSENVVSEALGQLAATARSLNQQLVVTLPREISFDDQAHVVRLTQQFAP